MKSFSRKVVVALLLSVPAAHAAPAIEPINAATGTTAAARTDAQLDAAQDVMRDAQARCAYQPSAARAACLRATKTTLRQAQLYATQPSAAGE